MELTEFITPAIVIALFLWLGKRIDTLGDDLKRDIADLREHMAKLEGFLAGRRDRDAV